MAAPYTGGCLCGTVRYRVTAEPLTLYACHCTDCQRRTGSAFALSMVVPRDAVLLERGEPVAYSIAMSDGRIKTGRSCVACGNRLWGEPVKAPAIAIVQPGTLDDTSWVRPVAHIWTRSAMPGTVFAPDAVKFERQAGDFAVLRKLWSERGMN
jgi:hypothetical protein